MDFKDELSERVKIVDEYMENFLPSDKYPKEIFEAMQLQCIRRRKAAQTYYGNGGV